ncbi:hypothetical protein M422DRAFT_247447 [Sphaerobolus stellatus SS14]|nr:hypothetical protein M422DRAFT_247447 [Sphaerobolus stellatus SS14]
MLHRLDIVRILPPFTRRLPIFYPRPLPILLVIRICRPSRVNIPASVCERSTTEMKSIGNSAIQAKIMSIPSSLAIQSELKFPPLDTMPRISQPSKNPKIATTPACDSHRHYRWRTSSVPLRQSPFQMILHPFTNENLRSSSRRNSPIYLLCRDRYQYATSAFNTSITQSSMHNREIQTGEARKYRFRKQAEMTAGRDSWKFNRGLPNTLGQQSAHTLTTTTPSLSHPLCSNNLKIAPIPAFHSHDIVDLASRVTVINVTTFYSNRKPTVTFETQ